LKYLALLAVFAVSAFAASSALAQPPKRPASTGTNASNHAVINGTGITHTGSGPGTVGGTPKNTAAGINGSAMRPKH
jgi:hypothetical protein